MRLREVCKLGEELVDRVILSTQEIKISRFSFTGNEVDLFCKNLKDFTLLESCFIKVMKSHDMFTSCVFKDKNSLTLVIIANKDIVRGFLEHLKPLIQGAKFNVAIVNAQSDIVNICSNFLEGKSVPQLTIDENEDFIVPYKFIEELRPEYLEFSNYPLSIDSGKSLLKLANMVDRLHISVRNNSEYNLVSLVRDVLMRKCHRFDLYAKGPNSRTTSLDDVEQLIQIFNRMGKPVSFRSGTSDLTNKISQTVKLENTISN